ncbi:MAG: 30S ribosomal protein S20 [Candidatus Curtissbacteria bacterium]|nr:30S ribosomal protein S20 [Candidatus Curtissbacteria bacterium]
MPVIKQAIKKVRQDKRKAQINLKVKSTFKSAIRAFRKHPSKEGLTLVFKSLDRAAKTNVIHANKAARLKSRLSKLVQSSDKKVEPKVKAATAK